MKKTDSAASELSFLLRMLHALPEAGSIEKIYRMLLSFAVGGRDVGFDRAMLLVVDSERGVINGHIGIERVDGQVNPDGKLSYEEMANEVLANYDRIDSSDLTLRLRTYSVPFGRHQSALVKAARSVFPVLAEGKLSEFSTDTFFEFFGAKSFIAVPLQFGGDVRAVLAADMVHSGQAIDIDDVSFLYSLSQQACQAVDNLLSATENDRKFRILMKLEKTLEKADTNEKIDEAIKVSLAMIGKAVGGTGTFLKDVLRNKTVHVKSVGAYKLDADHNDVAVAECIEKILDKVASKGRPISGDSGHALVEESVADTLSHFFVCPLSSTGDVSGAFGTYAEKKNDKRDRKAFSSSARRFLELCAGVIALKLANREKDERLYRHERFLEEVRSNLARERERSRIGEKGIEFHKKIESDILRMRKAFHSQDTTSKRLSRAEEILDEIEKNTLRYKAEFSLPDSHFKMVDIFKVVKQVVARWKQKAEGMGMNVTERIPSKGPLLLMDEEKISLAIENILKSISSSLQAEDKVLIEASTTNDKVRIVFADTGMGLPGNLLSRLFMPFAEVSSGDEKKRALSLAGEILHTHAGEIKIKTSLNWKTVLELSFAVVGNKDRRRNRGDRRRRTPDRRVPLKRG